VPTPTIVPIRKQHINGNNFSFTNQFLNLAINF
jgi:hypothetical protein